MSTLFVVATPIGNLKDLSPRALLILKEADLILAEDTRVTRKLLSAFSIATPLESCHEHNEAGKANQVVARMLAQEMQVALVTDAGTPSVSDPGALVVKAAAEAGIPVLAVPGPSAAAAALSVSGFTEGDYTFLGFLPRKKGELTAKLQDLAGKASLAVLYESPHRVLALLMAISEVYPGAQMSVSREISKLHEQTLRGSVEDLLKQFSGDSGLLRGEFCLVLQVPQRESKPEVAGQRPGLEARLMEGLVQGMSLRQAMEDLVTNQGEKKNAVYAASLRLKSICKEELG